MSVKVYVYSTLSNDQIYNTPEGPIFIAGKANVTNKNFITPRGVVTSVTAEQLVALKSSKIFEAHRRNGFVAVDADKRDPEEFAEKHLEERDNSAPPTEEVLKKKGRGRPKKDAE